MLSRSAALLEVLVQYCRKERPSYAVMIEGPWGCGKSYFLRRRLAEKLKVHKINVAFVSLYGAADIETVRMRLVGGCLASGNEKLASALTRMIDAATRLAGVKLSPGDLDVIPIPESVVVCFDDLERTDLPLRQVFGYINQLTEHSRRPVIVVANEQEVINVDGYLLAKEKVVGETYRLSLDLEPVFQGLLDDEVGDPALQDCLRGHSSALLGPFRVSSTENARVLRKAVLLSERLARASTAQSIPHQQLAALLRLGAALAIELDRDRSLESKLKFLLSPGSVNRPKTLPASKARAAVPSSGEGQTGKLDEFDPYFDRFANVYFEGALDAIPRVPLLLQGMFDVELDWHGIVDQYAQWSTGAATRSLS